ncbi:hypothetical protein KC799_10405 [candidate division KSB1 bacterium]|nr:hypothetical protein [candidate division KSB1 bacterium]
MKQKILNSISEGELKKAIELGLEHLHAGFDGKETLISLLSQLNNLTRRQNLGILNIHPSVTRGEKLTNAQELSSWNQKLLPPVIPWTLRLTTKKLGFMRV